MRPPLGAVEGQRTLENNRFDRDDRTYDLCGVFSGGPSL